MTIKDRVSEYCKKKNIAISRFESLSGLSNGYFNQVKKRPSLDKIESMVRAFPDLNPDWILTGEGEMMKPIKSVGSINSSDVTGVNENDIHINPNAYDTLLQIVETNQRATEKFQEQIDRLISLIEFKYGANNGLI